MSVSEKIWREYLEECEYEGGDLVMYMNPLNLAHAGRWPTHSTMREIAPLLTDTGNTPLRIFTADGKRQKGPDFDAWIKGRKSKRERVADVLTMYLPQAKGVSSVGTNSLVVDAILKICEIEDD
jgi:hypothetical protein